MSPEISSSWQNFYLEEPNPQRADSETSYSYFELSNLLLNTFNDKNTLQLAENPQLRTEYMRFLERIYKSEQTYYLRSALILPLESANPSVQIMGIEAFMHVFGLMGFTGGETAKLVDRWSDAMKIQPNSNTAKLILEGITHHAISLIGIERYKRGAFHELFKDFGISNTERYYNQALKMQFEYRNSVELPYFQFIMANHDYCSSMLGQSMLSRFAWDLLDYDWNLRKAGAAARFIEVTDLNDLVKRKQQLFMKYGPKKITGYYVYGHSDGDFITLGGNRGRVYEMSAEDMINLDIFGRETGENNGHPDIIFDSCSTGQKMAKRISKYFNARVYAPLVPAKIKDIVVKPRTRVIEKVVYNEPSIIFDCGKIVQVVEPRS